MYPDPMIVPATGGLVDTAAVGKVPMLPLKPTVIAELILMFVLPEAGTVDVALKTGDTTGTGAGAVVKLQE